MLSIIIPAYREPFLNKTIDSLLENATREIEILPVIDGYIPSEPIRQDPRVKVIELEQNTCGMRGAINAGLTKATGDFLMKLDAHCVVGQGYDKILTEDCAENYLVIPRRYCLDEKTWDKDSSRSAMDYHYLNYPVKTEYGYSMATNIYKGPQNRIRTGFLDSTMTFQGSCWVAQRKYFMEHVGYLDGRMETYGTFGDEPLEIGMKYWLGGGQVKVDKRTWYAHLSKRPRHYVEGLFSRKYKKAKWVASQHTWAAEHWLNNDEPGMVHPFSWLIEKFWPIPTWQENWQELWAKHLKNDRTL